MTLDYEKAFKMLETELSNGAEWSKKKADESEKEYYEDPDSEEKRDRWWFSNGAEWAYSYLKMYMDCIKVNPHLQKEEA